MRDEPFPLRLPDGERRSKLILLAQTYIRHKKVMLVDKIWRDRGSVCESLSSSLRDEYIKSCPLSSLPQRLCMRRDSLGQGSKVSQSCERLDGDRFVHHLESPAAVFVGVLVTLRLTEGIARARSRIIVSVKSVEVGG